MIMPHNTTKQFVVTAGVFIACFCIIATAIGLACFGRKYAPLVSIAFILIPVAIYYGKRWGYIFARTIYGGTAILLIGGTLNPFTYEDCELANRSYVLLLLQALLLAGLAILLFYCLGEHSKRRGIK